MVTSAHEEDSVTLTHTICRCSPGVEYSTGALVGRQQSETELSSLELISKQPNTWTVEQALGAIQPESWGLLRSEGQTRQCPSFLPSASWLGQFHFFLLLFTWLCHSCFCSTLFEYIWFLQELSLGVLCSGVAWFSSDCLCDLCVLLISNGLVWVPKNALLQYYFEGKCYYLLCAINEFIDFYVFSPSLHCSRLTPSCLHKAVPTHTFPLSCCFLKEHLLV